jgi:hypothetical protein
MVSLAAWSVQCIDHGLDDLTVVVCFAAGAELTLLDVVSKRRPWDPPHLVCGGYLEMSAASFSELCLIN